MNNDLFEWIDGKPDLSEYDLDEEETLSEQIDFYSQPDAQLRNTIGPAVERPIIPQHRPAVLGDFVFSPSLDERSAPKGRVESSLDTTRWSLKAFLSEADDFTLRDTE